jgi:hypothetical protein
MHGKYEANAWLVYGLGTAHVSHMGPGHGGT